MQFNVLAQKLEPAPINDSPEAVRAVDFAQRSELNFAHVAALRPNILVMEEVDDPAAFYAPRFDKIGYNCIAFAKPSGTMDYTCIFFDRASFVPGFEHRVVKFGTDDVPASQFAILAHFVSADADPARPDFVIAAQHAKAGRTQENEGIRLAHVQRLVLEEIPRFVHDVAASGKSIVGPGSGELDRRVLHVGDFNCGPHSYGGAYPCKVIPWLTSPTVRGETDCGGTVFESAMANALALSSSSGERAMVEQSDADALFTTCKMREGKLIAQTIDYVCFPRGAARCTGWLPCPTADPAKDLAPLFLPSSEWGSDHLSVYAEIEWVAPASSS